MDQQESVINLFLRDDNPLPRGTMRTYPVLDRRGGDGVESCKSLSEIMNFCKHNKDVYINLFSDWQKEQHVYDMIFLDIDNEDLQTSICSAIKIVVALEVADIHEYNMYFSGSKGFHIYIQMEPTLLNNYRVAVMGFLKGLNILDLLDKVVFEPNRVTRVPYSINSKTGMRCVPVTDILDVELCDLPNIQCEEQILKPNENLGKRVKEFDSEKREESSPMMASSKPSEMFSDVLLYPECITEMVDDAMDGVHLNHVQRMEMAKFLLHVHGHDIEKVSKYFEKQDNYIPSKTQYQLNYISSRDLKMLNCQSMDDQGLCPMKDQHECPFAPTLNSFIRKEMIQNAKMG